MSLNFSVLPLDTSVVPSHLLLIMQCCSAVALNFVISFKHEYLEFSCAHFAWGFLGIKLTLVYAIRTGNN